MITVFQSKGLNLNCSLLTGVIVVAITVALLGAILYIRMYEVHTEGARTAYSLA